MAQRLLFRLMLPVLAAILSQPLLAARMNGFELDNATVPVGQIERGGPPRDGIVAVTAPTMVAADVADFMQPTARVLGLVLQGEARAYPVRYLTVHEIVNDTYAGQHFTVTYCPLCGSGVAFATNVRAGVHLNFGVSGLLYNSDLLMYDRNTESLWSQLSGKAIAGALVGTELPRLALRHTTWRSWLASHPRTLVMAGHRKFRAMYRSNPYPGYAGSRRLYFAVAHEAPSSYHPKEWVLGVSVGSQHKAYPFKELRTHGLSTFDDTLGGMTLRLEWDADNESATVRDAAGRLLPATMVYWFAWYAFHPDTAVFASGE